MIYTVTYTAGAGRALSRDALTLEDARRDARRIAKRTGAVVKVWSEGGRLLAAIGPEG